MPTLLLGLLAAVFLIVMLSTLRWWATALIAVVIATTLVPRSLGIELGGVSLQTYDAIILAVLVIGFVASSGRPNFLLFLPFITLLLIGAAFEWEQSPELTTNVVYLLVGVGAWAVGHYLAKGYAPGTRHELVLVYLLAAVILFQAVVTVLQASGVPIFALQGRTAELEGGRASGTFSHPGTVGKVMILFMAIILPLTTSLSRHTRRIAYFAVLIALIPVGLSESRANFIGYLLTLLLWFIIMPARSAKASRLVVPAVVLAGAVAFSGTIIDRFTGDPEGGAREHFAEVALEAIGNNPWLGVGPGNYIPVVGQTDSLTAQGWRVHNIFLLEITELGIPGAFFFFLPALLLLFLSVRRMRRTDQQGAWARGAIAAAAGTLVTAVTGWGLMNGSIFMIWFLCMGFGYGMLRRKDLTETRREAAKPTAPRTTEPAIA
ncbi:MULTISPECIES: O-antigen ligase family protein [Microbacterium]|uniref:O-antigen ligase family protein n=1 Tax=Microbacterium TaxID=33882 RepID=UPI001D17011E|nr:O-antigen ligase family protein [Microbacterium testaceum]MCC4248612.1 O-antigen ligase family protein [Microbacterium testaceum]